MGRDIDGIPPTDLRSIARKHVRRIFRRMDGTLNYMGIIPLYLQLLVKVSRMNVPLTVTKAYVYMGHGKRDVLDI